MEGTGMVGRNSDVDTLRALLILYIIAVIHPLFWLAIGDGIPVTFLLFEMPCMFILSGYSFGLSLRNGLKINSIKDYLYFCINRGARILLPFWLYALACQFFLLGSGKYVLLVGNASVSSLVLAWINPYSTTRPSIGFLASHLWFIAPFLTVTFLLPCVARLKPRLSLPIWLWMLAALVLVKGLDGVDPDVRTAVTYLIWASFGYALASGIKISRSDRWITLSIAFTAIGLFAWLKPSSLNMQVNKFPPNAIFFIFGVVWVAGFMVVSATQSGTLLRYLDRHVLLRPFRRFGYTIYLWQGLAYTFAVELGSRFTMPPILIILIALSLTLLMAFVAAPFEQVRFGIEPRHKRPAEGSNIK
jgi:peptidoglycan/LPS O-acetylase OafA/YrhL